MSMTQQLEIQRLYDKAAKNGRANRGTETRVTEEPTEVRSAGKPKVQNLPSKKTKN
jgi:hypothetical protein